MLGNTILKIIMAILSTFLVFEYYRTFFELGKNYVKNRAIMCIYCIWQTLSLVIFEDIEAWVRLVFSIVFVIIVSACFIGDFIGKLVFAIIYNAIWMLGELLTGAVFLIIGLSLVEYHILGSALSKILLLLLIKVLQLFFYNDNMCVLSWKDNALLMLFPVGSMFFTYHLFMLSDKVGSWRERTISLIAFCAILGMNVVMFIVYINLSNTLELKRRNSIFQLEIDLYNEYIKEKENAMVEFRKSKHDLKHKLIFLLELLKNKEYEELEDYVKDLIDLKSLEGFAIVHSDNSLIDALINYKCETAKRYGIDFRVKIDIPTSFTLANSDLCVILGNALDNAIEANKGIAISKPYINLKMKYDKDNLIIYVENSFDGCIVKDRKGNILTRKKDKYSHGIGIISIQNTLVKYNGYMNIEFCDKIFKLTIIMYSDDK